MPYGTTAASNTPHPSDNWFTWCPFLEGHLILFDPSVGVIEQGRLYDSHRLTLGAEAINKRSTA
jgi:hypothetical protein